MITLNERKEIVLDIAKKLDIMEKADVVLDLDFSGSMAPLYDDGRVQKLLNRILPVGLAIDENQAIDAWLFHNGHIKIGDITTSNVDNVAKDARRKHSMGSTNYAPVLYENIKKFEKRGFMGVGSRKALDRPVLVIFITDGNNEDHKDTIAAIQDASSMGMFIATIGIGNANFDFLEAIDTMQGRTLDNVSFTKAKDIEAMSDEQLYTCVLKEYAGWIPQARAKGFIK